MVYYSDIELIKGFDNSVSVDPIGVSLAFTIHTTPDGCEYADFMGLGDLYARDDVSLSASERSQLLEDLDSVARDLN
jgi:hypothetical protein